MKHRRRIFLVLSLASAGVPAFAQGAPRPAPTESVTVTGIKDVDAAVTKFVGSMTVPTRVADRLARWRQGICPLTAGLRPDAVKFVIKRIRDVAAQVGAPVNDRADCKANIEIMFTTTPQALLDTIFIQYPYILGYHDNSAQATKLATVVWPIQSWYSTATDDLRGNVLIDGIKKNGMGMTLDMPSVPAGWGGGMQTVSPTVTMNLPDAQVTNVTGSRLGDGVSSDFHHVVVVAEPAKLLGYEIGTLADYIALLALSQTVQPEQCQELPTILNLLAPGCTVRPTSLTNVDLAYLRALYKMTPTTTVRGQRSEIVYQMDKNLGAEK
jgi:hypothetical protein